MAKKVLIISTSIRPNSNSEMLANAFADGAGTSGNEVELISLKNKIRFVGVVFRLFLVKYKRIIGDLFRNPQKGALKKLALPKGLCRRLYCSEGDRGQYETERSF